MQSARLDATLYSSYLILKSLSLQSQVSPICCRSTVQNGSLSESQAEEISRRGVTNL